MGEPQWNFDWITPALAVGGAFDCADAAALARQHRVGAVIDMREEACDDETILAAHGVEFLHLPTPDRLAVGQSDLDRGVEFARAVLAQRRRLLVHCQHGIGRSALLALCILSDRGESPMAALKRMKAARWCVSLSPEQYHGWTEWLRRHGHAAPVFDDFAEVAYAHLRQDA